MRIITAVSSLVVAVWGMGCVHAPVVYPPAPPLFYGVEYETLHSTQSGSLPRQSDVLAKDARKLLSGGRRVAFLPPDSCTTSSVVPAGTNVNSTEILMQCGALLASLEAEVAKSGYSVVSWQALKSNNVSGSQQRARELGVDVLFEVNQLSQGTRNAGARQVSNLRFSRDEGPGRSTPIPVMPAVAQRCAAQVSSLGAGEREYLSTVNLKAVDVSSGRALWLYQNTVVELHGRNEQNNSKLYYRAEGFRPPPPEQDSTLRTIGAIGVAVGAGLFLPGLIFSTLGEDDEELASTGGTMLGLGLVSGAVGGLAYGLDYAVSKPDGRVPPPVYPTEDQVLCAGTPEFDPWARPTQQAQASPGAQYSYTFAQTASAGGDPARERAERLTRKSTEDFVNALRQVAEN